MVERQCIKTNKASGIVNDANYWAIETMHNPRYPLELFLRVITVSLETIRIVNALPILVKDELSCPLIFPRQSTMASQLYAKTG